MPPTIEPETFGADDAPPVALIPTPREWPGGDVLPDVELREIDGLTVLPIYSSEQVMYERAGVQPFVGLLTELVGDALYLAGADVALWDIWIDPDVRHEAMNGHDDEEGDSHGDAG